MHYPRETPAIYKQQDCCNYILKVKCGTVKCIIPIVLQINCRAPIALDISLCNFFSDCHAVNLRDSALNYGNKLLSL